MLFFRCFDCPLAPPTQRPPATNGRSPFGGHRFLETRDPQSLSFCLALGHQSLPLSSFLPYVRNRRADRIERNQREDAEGGQGPSPDSLCDAQFHGSRVSWIVLFDGAGNGLELREPLCVLMLFRYLRRMFSRLVLMLFRVSFSVSLPRKRVEHPCVSLCQISAVVQLVHAWLRQYHTI